MTTKRILVAGELNVDLVMVGLPTLPVLGRELVGTDFRVALGSSSAITAARLAALGAEVDFAGIVGADDFGRFVLQELQRFGVNTEFVEQVEISTGVTIALTYSRDRALLTYPGTIAAYDGRELTAERLAPYAHLHVGAFYLQTGLQPTLPALFQLAHDIGLTTSLDVGWDPDEQWSANPHLAPTLQHTDYFLPNDDEAAALAPTVEELAALVHGLLIVKRGSQGAAAYNRTQQIATVPTIPVEVVDTTGAGDAFNAGFLYARCVKGRDLESAMQFAAACGAQAVTQVGGATGAPSAAMIESLLNQHQPQQE
jgi:sugar/nucleoside kinase (ribokinase family)